MRHNILVVGLGLSLLAACTDLLEWNPSGPGFPDPPVQSADMEVLDGAQVIDSARVDGAPASDGGPAPADMSQPARPDAALQDAAVLDVGHRDAAERDAELRDAVLHDAVLHDATLGDAALTDVASLDAGLPDAVPPDAVLQDARPLDAAAPDALVEPPLIHLGLVSVTQLTPQSVVGYFDGPEGQVFFDATRHEGERVIVEWRAAGEESLVVELVGFDQATLTFADEVIDGHGGKDPGQLALLDELAEGPIAQAMAVVPQELTCLLELDRSDIIAAMTFGWQMLLKYSANPVRPSDAVPLVACQSVAAAAELGIDPPRALVEADTGMPRVFGIFPLDAEGVRLRDPQDRAVRGEPIGFISEGGPCPDDRCPGTCGMNCAVSCDDTETVETCALDDYGSYTGIVNVVETTLNCGSHPLCRAHDGCYDDCSRDFGCGTGPLSLGTVEDWFIAGCRRRCDDVHCLSQFLGQPGGMVICGLFALGVPPVPFDDTRLHYRHESARIGFQTCRQGSCDPAVLDQCGHCPTEEFCDGEDDDCDAVVDEAVCDVRCGGCLQYAPGAPQNRPGCSLNAPASDVVSWCDYNNNLCRNGIRWCADRPPVDPDDRCCNRAGYEACRACCATCGCAQGC